MPGVLANHLTCQGHGLTQHLVGLVGHPAAAHHAAHEPASFAAFFPETASTAHHDRFLPSIPHDQIGTTPASLADDTGSLVGRLPARRLAGRQSSLWGTAFSDSKDDKGEKKEGH